MVVVQLKGGLGNQMFQYAAGLALARRSGCGLSLDTSHVVRDSKRSYALDQWAIEETVQDALSIRLRFETFDCEKLPGRWLHRLGLAGCVYQEPHFPFDSDLWRQDTPVLLKGYWQSYRYLEGIDDKLRDRFTPVGEWPQQMNEVLERIQGHDAVAIHVRRGDYVTDPVTNRMHGLCPLDYYHEALSAIRAHGGGGEVFVFTDDPLWAERELLPQVESILVSGSSALSDAQELWLMSRAANQVISNSSFSWWAAWLAEAGKGMVVAPRNWFADCDHDTSDLLPAQWLQI